MQLPCGRTAKSLLLESQSRIAVFGDRADLWSHVAAARVALPPSMAGQWPESLLPLVAGGAGESEIAQQIAEPRYINA